MRVPSWKLVLEAGPIGLGCGLIGVRPVEAHEGHTHVMGTVTALTDGQMVVQTKDGCSETIRLDRNTRYRATGVASSSGTVSVGDRVVVEITEEAGGLLATEVRYAPEAAPAR